MTHHLTDEQERIRLEGLRILARIIARHVQDNPDLYGGSPTEQPLTPSQEDAGDEADRRT